MVSSSAREGRPKELCVTGVGGSMRALLGTARADTGWRLTCSADRPLRGAEGRHGHYAQQRARPVRFSRGVGCPCVEHLHSN